MFEQNKVDNDQTKVWELVDLCAIRFPKSRGEVSVPLIAGKIKRGLWAKSMGVSRVRTIVLD